MKSITHGARIDGSTYGARGDAPWDQGTWDLFEQHIGKKVSGVHWGQPLGSLDLTACHLAQARRAQSLISYDDGPGLDAIAKGEADGLLRSWADRIAQFDGVLWLRPMWEMNGTWYRWGRHPRYVDGWRRMVGIVRERAANARFVWCVNTIWDAASDPKPQWPGSDFVDWVGIDGYNRNEPWKSPSQVFDPTLKRLAEFTGSAPWMICETGCEENGGDKAAWLRGFLSSWLPKHARIRAMFYFNWPITEGGKTRTWPVESSPASEAAYRRSIAAPYFR